MQQKQQKQNMTVSPTSPMRTKGTTSVSPAMLASPPALDELVNSEKARLDVVVVRFQLQPSLKQHCTSPLSPCAAARLPIIFWTYWELEQRARASPLWRKRIERMIFFTRIAGGSYNKQ